MGSSKCNYGYVIGVCRRVEIDEVISLCSTWVCNLGNEMDFSMRGM